MKNITISQSAAKKSIKLSVNHSVDSHRKCNSSSSDSQYIALLGSEPTKLTIKRLQTSSAGSSSEVVTRIDNTNSLKSSTETSKSKEAYANSSSQQADCDPSKTAVATVADKKMSNVVPLDLSAQNRKRTHDSLEKHSVKKQRLTTTQTVASQQPTAVQSMSKNSLLSLMRRQSLTASVISFTLMQQHNQKFKQQNPTSPAASFLSPIPVTASTPMPPNWLDNYEDTIMSLHTFKKYDIEPATAEYRTIESMLQPIQVNRIKQIVNPDVWKRFISTRKEMLRSKTNDLNILSELGLDERDVMRCTHLVLNQAKDLSKDQLHPPYSDNMALLFHCTKTETSLNSILSQGLDERLSNVLGGRLGKGCYFADDPQKSIQYDGIGRILIFAVLLGDCVSVDDFPFKSVLVREPEKRSTEMRNLKDLFFDSIVGRPAGYNEYVIFNRHQCCPLYEIEYKRQVLEDQPLENSDYSPKHLPPFAWLPTPVPKVCHNWPFYASEIFKKMGARPSQYEICSEIAPLTVDTNTEQTTIDKKLATLFTFGFCDADRNKEILFNFSGDLYQTINYLLDENVTASELPSPQPSIVDGATLDNSIQLPIDVADFLLEFDASNGKPNPTEPQQLDECSICCNEYQSFTTAPELWKKLKCGHKLCLTCHAHMLKTRTTMSGVEQTFLKCPFCHDITGIQIGNCPDIQMKISLIANSCDGYESTNTISINYFVDSVYQLNRIAYLPNNREGQEVLKLLKVACDRRLCFTIGESITTGQQNVLVWGIHHKTSMKGGVSSYGYPDAGYMDRVKLELKSYGIS